MTSGRNKYSQVAIDDEESENGGDIDKVKRSTNIKSFNITSLSEPSSSSYQGGTGGVCLRSKRMMLAIITCLLLLFFSILFFSFIFANNDDYEDTKKLSYHFRNHDENMLHQEQMADQNHDAEAERKKKNIFPTELIGSVYNIDDFKNGYGNIPAYWKDIYSSLMIEPENINSTNQNIANSTVTKYTQSTWGPCYPPNEEESKSIDWTLTSIDPNAKGGVEYPLSTINRKKKDKTDVSNMCRPGFLIIGAGKCGTSSLYHYLIGHPRVLPASEKQVHYFRYYANRDLQWYYQHFPTTKSFLSSGALMTGEAAPGYIPYPEVSHLVAQRMPGPKILTIAREPLDRAWSSYNYNYVREALRIIKSRGAVLGFPKGKSEDYYKEYHIFSFEDFIQVELKLLKQCLKPDGVAETKSKKMYRQWFEDEYNQRERDGLPPMVDIIKFCYPQPKYKNLPREQWNEMIKANPQKLIKIPNLHLLEAFIGRGMYAAQVEWWYAAHPKEDNYLVCTEDLKERPAETMLNVSRFVGLPEFNFTDVVREGMYNVAGHKGYDKATSWEEVLAEEESKSTEIPLSDDLRNELTEFLQEHNERLFTLAGKRCPW